jgi:plastocyanin
MIKRRTVLTGLAGLALLLPRSWAAAAGEVTDGAKVTIDNFTFDPPLLTVKAGTVVTWVNHDDIPHTVVATNGAFKSHALDTDDAFTFTFTTSGRYEYFCSLHPHMKATIVIEAAAK